MGLVLFIIYYPGLQQTEGYSSSYLHLNIVSQKSANERHPAQALAWYRLQIGQVSVKIIYLLSSLLCQLYQTLLYLGSFNIHLIPDRFYRYKEQKFTVSLAGIQQNILEVWIIVTHC